MKIEFSVSDLMTKNTVTKNTVTMREEHIKFMSKPLPVDFTKVNVRWLRNLVEKKVMEHFSLGVTKQNKTVLSSHIDVAEKKVYVFIDYCYFPFTDEMFPLNSFEITVDDIPII